jgi:hypothetical protein
MDSNIGSPHKAEHIMSLSYIPLDVVTGAILFSLGLITDITFMFVVIVEKNSFYLYKYIYIY